MKKKLVLIVPVLIVLCLLFSSNDLLPVISASDTAKDEIENELLVALFFKDIDSAVQNYYSDYFSIPLEVYNYEIQIKDMSKVNNIITIHFVVTPQIGAHNPVGYDEITFSVDNNGQREFLAYEHIKTYTLDKRFNEYIIKPLPLQGHIEGTHFAAMLVFEK